jgi:hypothetical protein
MDDGGGTKGTLGYWGGRRTGNQGIRRIEKNVEYFS